MKSSIVRRSNRALVGALTCMVGLFASGITMKVSAKYPEFASPLLTSTAIGVSSAIFFIGGLYSTYLAVGALRSSQFPAPTAVVPTDCRVRHGVSCLACIALMAVNGAAMVVFGTWLAITWM